MTAIVWLWLLLADHHWLDTWAITEEESAMPVAGAVMSLSHNPGSGLFRSEEPFCEIGTIYVNGVEAGKLHMPLRNDDRPIAFNRQDTMSVSIEQKPCPSPRLGDGSGKEER